jgi:exosome complex component RRP4
MKEKTIAVPGDIIAEGMDYLPSLGCFREDKKIISERLGLLNVDNRFIKVIPLTGNYVPKVGDTIIGEVKDMSFGAWFVDIGSAYDGTLMVRDATEFIEKDADLAQVYNFGDWIIAKVVKITRHSSIHITTKGPGLRKIQGGKIVSVTPSKVPRVIGKQASMIGLIKEHTDCSIVVGQNGKIWIKGKTVEGELLATEAVLKVENESHIEGLTDKMKLFLESKKK